jgi:hypothetical protein
MQAQAALQQHVTSTGKAVATWSTKSQQQRPALNPKEQRDLDRAVAKACNEQYSCALAARALKSWQRWTQGVTIRHCVLCLCSRLLG